MWCMGDARVRLEQDTGQREARFRIRQKTERQKKGISFHSTRQRDRDKKSHTSFTAATYMELVSCIG